MLMIAKDHILTKSDFELFYMRIADILAGQSIEETENRLLEAAYTERGDGDENTVNAALLIFHIIEAYKIIAAYKAVGPDVDQAYEVYLAQRARFEQQLATYTNATNAMALAAKSTDDGPTLPIPNPSETEIPVVPALQPITTETDLPVVPVLRPSATETEIPVFPALQSEATRFDTDVPVVPVLTMIKPSKCDCDCGGEGGRAA
jgi:hypothetical protein